MPIKCLGKVLSARMQFQFDLSSVGCQVLIAHLSPGVEITGAQGWEECVNASMMHLLRTVLAKSTKDISSVVPALTFPRNTSRLRKHITIVLKRIKAGGSLCA